MRWQIAALALALAAGCDNSADTRTTSPAPSHPAQDASNPPAATVSPDAGNAAQPPAALAGSHYAGDGISWDLPAGWTQHEGQNMRIATLLSDTGVEVSVTGFGGAAGGLTANVNRWRGQVGLPALPDADVEKSTQKTSTSNGQATLVDVTGTGADAQRLIAAIVPGTGRTFFFKMTGPSNRLEEAKAPFLALLKSVKTDAAQ